MARKNNKIIKNKTKRKTKRKIKTKNKLRGGMIRKNHEHANNFQALVAMMQNPSAKLIEIAGSSLKGFVFSLEIDPIPGNEEFLGVNEEEGAFTKPIYSVAIKFCIISDYQHKLRDLVLDRESYDKDSVSFDDFENEAKMQQKIYLETLYPRGKYICPAVIDFAVFDSINAANFLEKLGSLIENRVSNQTFWQWMRGENLSQKRPDTQTMIDYLLRTINQNKTMKLGCIIMQHVDSSYVELGDLIKIIKPQYSPEVVEQIYLKSCSYGIALLLVMVVKCKIIPLDFHNGNLLTKLDGSKVLAIDFDRMLRISMVGDPIITENVIKKYFELSGGHHYYDDILYLFELNANSLWNTNKVKSTIHNILRIISCIDCAINFSKKQINFPQMISLLAQMYGYRFDKKGRQLDWNDWRTPPDWDFLGSKEYAVFFKKRVTQVIPIFQCLTEGSPGDPAFSYKRKREEEEEGEEEEGEEEGEDPLFDPDTISSGKKRLRNFPGGNGISKKNKRKINTSLKKYM
jgi:hypothetical protein